MEAISSSSVTLQAAYDHAQHQLYAGFRRRFRARPNAVRDNRARIACGR
jgi:hypothetical protein